MGGRFRGHSDGNGPDGPKNRSTSTQQLLWDEFIHRPHQTAFSRAIVWTLFASRRIVGNDQGSWCVGSMTDLESPA